MGLMRSQSRHPQDCVPSRGSRGESSADSSCLCGLLLPSTKAAIGVRPVFVVAVDRAGFSLVGGFSLLAVRGLLTEGASLATEHSL